MERSKKIKAAIMGVLYYLQENEKENKKQNRWVQTGRTMIMQNRMMVQRREMKR